MSISSLPSPYGIGTLGKAAYDFADFLHEAGQKYWQMLPLGPTSFGDSPYQSFSSFAGNPYFIDLDMLIEDGLLKKSDLKGIDFGTDPRSVDYGKIFTARFKLLEIAKENGWERDRQAVQEFESRNHWLGDYVLYMACKRYFKMKSWSDWDDNDIRVRKPEAMAKYREMLRPDIELFTYIQFLFYKQWEQLRKYLVKLGIQTIGDMPIYVSLDSADVWSEPWFFQLDENYVPKCVAGVPPDYFSEDGQLWGNPLYDWDKIKNDGYGWWIRRIDGATKLYDVIRIDHFRGFSEYWSVPYGEKTAKNGKWMKGPGMDLIGVLSGWFRSTSFIAEDLGTPTDGLRKLLQDSGWPGMKVLEFAFDSGEESSFLPHSYVSNCICYTGTHDNATLLEWMEDAKMSDILYAFDYLGLSDSLGLPYAADPQEHKKSPESVSEQADPAGNPESVSGQADPAECPESSSDKPAPETCASEESSRNAPESAKKLLFTDLQKHAFVWGIIQAGQRSVADLFISQIQDYLELGKGNRMNSPSTLGCNWAWRMLPGETTSDLARRIRHLTRLYGRL